MLYDASTSENAEFIYPFTNPNEIGQHTFAQRAGEPQDPTFKEMLSELKKANKTCVLSSEELCYLSEDALASIREAFPQADVSIIFYQRNILTLMHPWWQEKLKHGSEQSFLEFALDCLIMPQHLHLLVPNVLLDAWSKYFGRDAVQIFLFDQIPDVAAQFAADVLELDSSKSGTSVSNRSYSYVDCELIRFWNLHGFWGAGVIQSPEVHQIHSDFTELSTHFLGEFHLSYEIQEFARIEQHLLSCWRDRIKGANGNQLFTLRHKFFPYIRSDIWVTHREFAERVRMFADQRPEYSSWR
ncbi:hypothetical protein [Methylobacterium sp. UNC378MF]|uniref:hypothetical protein n=1 Tax=Methylobacterium sp. UNC378MF TaxID=1502748 RepID=UPI001AECDC44|nr:hypothetical protein [Methylobacterium sp. UNC378MF]